MTRNGFALAGRIRAEQEELHPCHRALHQELEGFAQFLEERDGEE